MTEQNPLTPEEEKSLMEEKKKILHSFTRNVKRNTSIGVGSTTPMSSFRYNTAQIDRFLQNPSQFQRELRQLSNYLYDYSPEYRNIVEYMSNLGEYRYVLDTLNILDEDSDLKMYKNAKLKVSGQLDKMNLPHELAKISRVMWKQDIFYGYEIETKDTFTIFHVNADYCRLSGIDYDGVFLYEFDFSYFDHNIKLLDAYPEEFQRKYSRYKNTNEKWQPLDPKRSFAFKINEETPSYPLIPYAVLFSPILDFEEAKKMHKARIALDNFMLLVQQIPINDATQNIDDFKISVELANEFHIHALDALANNPGIGLITSPLPIEAVRTDKGGKNERDNMSIGLRSIFDAGGLSQFLFNSDKATSTGVNQSLIVNEQKIYKIYRQMERWLNRKLRSMSGRFKFKARLLDITSFDDGDSFDKHLQAAQSGMPVTDEMSASLGVGYKDLSNRLILENSEYGLQDKMKPLATSHTQSAKDKDSESGRPEVSDEEVADSTVINRDANTDEDWQNQ